MVRRRQRSEEVVETHFFPPKLDQRPHQHELLVDPFPHDPRHDAHQCQTDVTNTHTAIEDNDERKDIEERIRGDTDLRSDQVFGIGYLLMLKRQ